MNAPNSIAIHRGMDKWFTVRKERAGATFELATELFAARQMFASDEEFGVWLRENELDELGKDNLAAFIQMGGCPEVSAAEIEEITSHVILQEVAQRLPIDRNTEECGATSPEPEKNDSAGGNSAECLPEKEKSSMEMTFHPIANLFPLLPEDELTALADDIARNGLHEPIWTYQNQVIDGRNRYKACARANVEPTYREWDGNGSLVAFAWSLNGARRHLTSSQKAAVSVEILPLLEQEAAERRAATLKQNATRESPTVTQKFGERHDGESAAQAANLTGTNRQYVSDAKNLRQEFPDLFERVKSGELTITEAKAEIKTEKKLAIAEQIKQEPKPMPEGPYRVIVIDPPWRYDTRAEDITHRARTSYPDMSMEEIKAIPVASLAHQDSILWLWTTNAFMEEAYVCVRSWGFEPKTILTWVKDRMGAGNWLRGQTEHCIMAVRGNPIVTLSNQTTALSGPLREHSRKPDEFYHLVDSLCPGSKVELFAREPRDGWATWGAEEAMFA
jgi:N6-adenosine-specific RNA methylase IME4